MPIRSEWGALALALAVSCLFAAARSGAADDEEEAKKHFQLGAVMYNEGNYEAALVEFKTSYKYKKNWKVFYQLGVTYQALHDFVAAEQEFQAYLEEGGDQLTDEKRDEVKEIIAEMDSVIGSIVIDADVDGALVYVDDELVGATPLKDPVRVNIGSYKVKVKFKDEEPFVQSVDVAGGEPVKLDVQFTAAGTAPPPDEDTAGEVPVEESGAGAQGDEEGAGGDVPEEPETPQPPSKAKLKPGVFYGMLGVTGALLVGMAVTGGVAIKNHDDFEATDVSDVDRRSSLRDRGQKLNLAADVLLGLMAASAITSIVLIFFTDFPKKEKQAKAVVPLITAGGGGLAFTMDF